jgi:hypothetical protein
MSLAISVTAENPGLELRMTAASLDRIGIVESRYPIQL